MKIGYWILASSQQPNDFSRYPEVEFSGVGIVDAINRFKKVKNEIKKRA
jgi:hypothetical protein